VTKIAILNDWQSVALSSADWTVLPSDAEITVFNEALPEDEAARAAAIADFEVICLMRERTAFPRSLLERLPNLKLLNTTAMGNRTIDMAAAHELGITVCGTRGAGNGTAELTWGLIVGLARRIYVEREQMKAGRWQTTLGDDVIGHTLGILGLGNIGARVASVRDGRDRLEPEPDTGEGAGGRRPIREQGAAIRRGRLPDAAPGAERPHAGHRGRGGPGAHEADRVSGEHVAGAADRREGAAGHAA
jgi:hypothetical protein